MKEKICNKCKTTKLLIDFYGNGKGQYSSHCKQCKIEFQRKRYTVVTNTPELLQKRKERTRQYRKNNPEQRKKDLENARTRNRSFIIKYLNSHPCVDCGESDIVVLDFDHTNPKEKEYEVSQMISNGKSIQSIQNEIDKCEIRCSNCHRKRHAKESKSWRVL